MSGSAGTYAAIGLFALARPAAVPRLFGGSAPTAASRTEIRAVYGGLPLALALTLGRALGSSGSRADGALDAVARSAGMAAGRIAGAALDRRLAAWPTGAFLLIEATLAGALFAAADRDGAT